MAMIEMKGVSKWYGAVIGVNEVTLDIGPGIIAGVILELQVKPFEALQFVEDIQAAPPAIAFQLIA